MDRESCSYTECFCEENVYKFIEANQNEIDSLYAIIITNEAKYCPIWCQKSSNSPSTPVFWDYHAIVGQKLHGQALVYDCDTTLDFPCGLSKYFSSAFRPSPEMAHHLKESGIEQQFRLIKGSDFLEHFSSDRSHMKEKETGEWISKPPPYDAIFKPHLGHNLNHFLDGSDETLPGVWMNFREIKAYFH